MALTDKISAIAEAIRSKTGTTDTMTLAQMPELINGIETGGGGFPNGTEWSCASYYYARDIEDIIGNARVGWIGLGGLGHDYVYRSDDGISWDRTELAETKLTGYYSDRLGKWFVSTKNGIYYSVDRIEWTQALSASNSGDDFVEYNRYIYCFDTSNSGCVCQYSMDGVSWTQISEFNFLVSIVKRDGRMLGFNSQYVWYTDDGVTWASNKLANTYTSITSCLYDSGRYVAVGSNNGILYSDDGVSWTVGLSLTGGSANRSRIENINGTWVAITVATTSGGGTAKVRYSTDGISWTASSIPNRAWSTRVLQKCNGVLWMVGGSEVHYSKDGVTWNLVDAFPDQTNFSVVWDAGVYIASTVGHLHYSLDGVTWTECSTPTEFDNYGYAPLVFRCGNAWVSPLKSGDTILYSQTWAPST